MRSSERPCNGWLIAAKLGAAATLAAVFGLGGCATAPTAFDTAGSRELAGVPFFPQTELDCGPAALATVLVDAGIEVHPDQLVPAVYVAGLEGSLQAELLAAARRYGRIPYPIEPSPEALLTEIENGRPVLVMQNLGLARVPIWHYAVVVGFDAERDRVVLRSGTERRRLERTDRFLRRWRLADHWGFVVVEPDTVPASATPARYLRALVEARNALTAAALEPAYDAALARWPDDALTLFAAANHAQSQRRWAEAVSRYRRLLERDPDHAAARNNLAHALFEAGCAQQGVAEARRALDLLEPGDPFTAAIADTVRALEQRALTSVEACALL